MAGHDRRRPSPFIFCHAAVTPSLHRAPNLELVYASVHIPENVLLVVPQQEGKRSGDGEEDTNNGVHGAQLSVGHCFT